MSVLAAPSPNRQDVSLYLVLSDEPALVHLGLHNLLLDKSVDTRILDVVAQRLVESPPPVANKKDEAGLDTLRLSAKLLGSSKNARYATALTVAAQKYKQELLLADIAAAKAQLGEPAVEAYRPGSLTLAGEKNRIGALFKDYRQRGDRKLKLQSGGPNNIQRVLDRLGAPDHIGESGYMQHYNLTQDISSSLKALKAAKLEFMYFGRGSIVFGYDQDWTAVETLREIPHPLISYTGDNPEYAYKLMSADRFVFNRLAKTLYAPAKKIDPDLMDIIADRLWLGMNSRDKVEVEGLTILCWIIGDSGNARYRQVLGDLVSGARDRRLSRHARRALGKLAQPSADVEVYQRRLLPVI